MRVGDKIALGFAAAMVFVVVLFVAYAHVSETRLAESQAKVQKSERIIFYEQLAQQEESAAPEKTASAPLAPEIVSSLRTARETVAAYAELFQQKNDWCEEMGYTRPLLLNYPRDSDPRNVSVVAPQSLIDRICATAELGGPVCVLDFSESLGFLAPYLRDIDDCAYIAGEYARAKLAGGDFAEALRGFLAVMNLADALVQEPLSVSQSQRRNLYISMIENLDYKALTPELAKAMIERLGCADHRGALRETLQGELQLAMKRFERWRNQSYSSTISASGLYWGTRSWLWARPVCRPWFNKDQQIIIDLLTRMSEIPNQPYYQVKPALNQLLSDVTHLPGTNMVAKWNVERHLGDIREQARFEFALNLAQTRIAIEQYRAKHGTYPATLDAVAEWFGGALPIDPFTGQRYRYLLDGETYILNDRFSEMPSGT